MKKKFYVYLMTRARNSTFYTGLTSNLPKRIWEHKNEVVDGFTKKHNIKMLAYYEVFEDYENAARKEKRLKRWPRPWKMKVIEEMNPDWKDLYEDICR